MDDVIGRRLHVTLAVAGGAIGVLLLVDPRRDLDVLALLCGAGLLLLGIDRATSDPSRFARLFVGIGWVLAGVVAPFVSFRQLAVVVGVGLVGGGVIDLIDGVRRDRRSIPVVVSGLIGIAAGLTALSWPTVTALVLSTCLGVRLLWWAIDGLLAIRNPGREERAPTRIVPRLALLAVVLVALVVSVSINRSQPDGPGAFYDAPAELPGPPGTLIRSEIVDPFVDGATASRVLYVTTDRRGETVTASGLVVVPDGEPPEGGRPVAAINHGTIGIARNCAPSLIDGDVYGPAIPGITEFLDAGFVVAATDYAGLGSDAVTGYLVGDDEAFSVLDNVRAAGQVPGVATDGRFVVFGESQGGHASLFAGEQAATYAPDLDLIGVAAAAPATDLSELLAANVGTPFGDILTSFALVSWEAAYAERDLDLASVVDGDAILSVRRLAELCIQDQRQIAALFPEAAILATRFLVEPLWDTEPWRSILEENTPGRAATEAPILVLQGTDDPLVLPAIQEQFVTDRLCSVSPVVEFRLLPDTGHLDAGHASAATVAEWALARANGESADSTC